MNMLLRRLPVLPGIVLLFAFSTALADDSLRPPPHAFTVSVPHFVVEGIPFAMEITAVDAAGGTDTTYTGTPTVEGVMAQTPDGLRPLRIRAVAGLVKVPDAVAGESGLKVITVSDGGAGGKAEVRSIPGFYSILPPLLAILLALTLRQVIMSLFAGVWLGATFMYGYNPLTGLLRLLDQFILGAISNPDHTSIIVFTLLFGGMVGVISRNGGTFGIADLVLRFSKNARMGQLGAWLLGVIIFFDDYANCLIVGNTMRPITDKLKVSREKLAYLVDSTAAPVSSIFFVSTWIGYEVGLIDHGLKSIDYPMENAYLVFLETIPFRFYPLLTLIMGFMVASMGRDWGPMLKAERRARTTGKVLRDGALPATDTTEGAAMSRDDGVKKRWFNGLIPIVTVLGVGMVSLYLTGLGSLEAAGSADRSIGAIIGASNSFQSLLWASFAGCAVAILLTLGQKLLSLEETMVAWVNGFKSMLMALIILVLAWTISDITRDLHTADYVAQILKGNLPVHFLPVMTFVISALVSFSTGTSWGTMGIVMPIVIPLTVVLSRASGLPSDETHLMLLGSISSVLAGSVFGDHCSPISDTTILSSMASSCDHIDHVSTQLPYALFVGCLGMVVGDIPTAFGFSPYLSILVGTVVIIAVTRFFGRHPETA
jgi:Na+/H+ antiporter NhaC